MPKQKKAPEKQATLQVDAAEFTRVRDAILAGLGSLQTAVHNLSNGFIAHSNTILGLPATQELLPLTSGLEDPNFRALPINSLPLNHTSPDGDDAGDKGEKKKKKKRYHDPDAPKRPLTPYFLYMQSARALIAEDLGPNAKPGEVSNEGTARWQSMPEAEKAQWKHLYASNLQIYQGKMAAYKLTISADPAAQQLATEGAGTVEPIEQDHELAVPPRAPTPPKEPKSSKRRKLSKAAEAKNAASKQSAPVAPIANMAKTAVPVPVPEPEKVEVSSKKKKKATPKKTKGAAAAAPVVEAPVSEKKGRKKRKSEAVDV
ncbi:MAG: hypothetical protein M1814_001110 [Vezdaea aestivalis]|nr:MAG: hypothetical protein M1814_001110 [Vezdaea aestivalis]